MERRGGRLFVYGLMTDGEGRPVAVEAYPGNTGIRARCPAGGEVAGAVWVEPVGIGRGRGC